MILGNLKKACAGILGIAVVDLTTSDGIDLFLMAANNAKDNAQLLHNFEFSRVQATLSIDGETGGALSAASFTDTITASTVTVAGTLSPSVAGDYLNVGVYNGQSFYQNGNSMVFYSDTNGAWSVASALAEDTNFWLGSETASVIAGVYAHQGTNTGNATVTLTATYSTYSGIKEVIAIQRTNVDGILVPLEFTRADIPIERDRYELELSREYEPYRRYPSDANLLQRGSNGTLILRGSTIFIYPVGAVTTTPLTVTLECYGQLRDYIAADLASATPTDFLCEHGGMYMQWFILCELNYRFKVWVGRTEGNLSPPEKERDNAWRDLLLWDTYMVDSHITRSR